MISMCTKNRSMRIVVLLASAVFVQLLVQTVLPAIESPALAASARAAVTPAQEKMTAVDAQTAVGQ